MINGLVTLDCEQGSDEWFKARLGIPTATGLSSIVSASGAKSTASNAYLAELIAECVLGAEEGFKSKSMQRGNDLEPLARGAYEFLNDVEVTQVGGIYLNDNKDLMISPDGIMPGLKKGLEIKCPDMKTHIKYILEEVLPSEYIIQVQSSLWVTGYESWDFMSYCPEYKPQTCFILTVKPDPKIQKAFDKYVPPFLERLDAFKRAQNLI
ncbi:YqaJ viral recombinase family protein [Oligella urethralis]|uniref:YqaJ viral recombinase family protein n=1 Tax=Oligella urethralis TaxID=90245 RepID=UPI00242E4392|nr:YqaJ viral recombinase family protein [Oligella urethralis]